MYLRLAAVLLALTALAPAVKTAAKPKPSPTPLKVIAHTYSRARLCMGLKRSIAPAVAKILQVDTAIATSRPILQEYVKQSDSGSAAGKDMAVNRLEALITPMAQNTAAIEQYLNDPLYARKPQNDNDKQLLATRAQLQQALDDQKKALDLVSGFVQTQQMGQLQAAGHEFDSTLTQNSQKNITTPQPAPSQAPDSTLTAGLPAGNDPTRQIDPKLKTGGSDVGYNPLNAFDQQMNDYQLHIAQNEADAALGIMKTVKICGGKAP